MVSLICTIIAVLQRKIEIEKEQKTKIACRPNSIPFLHGQQLND